MTASTASDRTNAPAPPLRVLSTLNADGSRRWIRPRVSPGRFLSRRRVVAYALIALFTVLPYVRVAGKPAILLDIAQQEFTFAGATFFATDTVVLALFLLSIFVGIFLVTALLGRAWCGWTCPQTVYMEFIFRPLERLFDGPPRRGGLPGTRRNPLRTVLKYASFLVVSLFLAHVFLAYFVGVDALALWVRRSPLGHPASFLVMAATTGLMLVHFSFFREQLCIVACPYGRFQSVLTDRHSLIVAYDRARGEPRGRHRKGPGAEALGDCVDCDLCVETCPTGIDIRDGLRMECVHCAQCIDACDAVMDKVGKPRGLIRYGSQAAMAGEGVRWIRPRVVIYPLLLVALGTAFAFAVGAKRDADVRLLRGPGAPFARLEDGRISNPIRIKVTHRASEAARYRVSASGEIDAEVVLDRNPFLVEPGESTTEPGLIVVAASVFADGAREIRLRIEDGAGFVEEIPYRLLGPKGGSR